MRSVNIDKLIGARLDPSGATIGFVSGSKQRELTIPPDQILNLFLMALQLQGQSSTGADKGLGKTTLPTEWWEFGTSPDGRQVILSFRVQGGAELSFTLDQNVVAPMRDTLSSMLGIAIAVPPGTTKQ